MARNLLFGILVLIIGLVFFVFVLTIDEESKIQKTKVKIKEIVEITEKLDRFKNKESLVFEGIKVGTDGWNRPIMMKFINEEIFIVRSDGSNPNDEVDDIWKIGHIE